MLALSVTFGASSPKGGAKSLTGTFLASPFDRLPPRRGKMSRERQKGEQGGIASAMTERARPLAAILNGQITWNKKNLR